MFGITFGWVCVLMFVNLRLGFWFGVVLVCDGVVFWMAYCTPPAGCLLVGWCWWSFVIFVAVVVWSFCCLVVLRT